MPTGTWAYLSLSPLRGLLEGERRVINRGCTPACILSPLQGFIVHVSTITALRLTSLLSRHCAFGLYRVLHISPLWGVVHSQFTTSQLHNFTTSQLYNFTTLQLHNFTTSQFTTSQLHNKKGVRWTPLFVMLCLGESCCRGLCRRCRGALRCGRNSPHTSGCFR